jgi:hypothetical protein
MNLRRVRILTPVFFERFFDSDFAAGAASLKTSFFWMVSFLAVPGMAMPVIMSTPWYFAWRFHGLAFVDIVSRTDKVLYLGYGAWAVGLVTATAWNAMLLDRRDGLVLGGLPVGGGDVVSAKTLAVFGYAALLMICIHTGASLSFGLFLGNVRGVGAVIATTLAHLAGSSLCGLFVFFAILALQGVALMVAGGRRFARVSPLLQLGVVAFVLAGGFALPRVVDGVKDTIAGGGAHYAPWILKTPMLWYVGVYDVLLGSRDPQLLRLALTGVLALVAVIAIAIVALPLSYRRVMAAAVEQSTVSRGRHRGAAVVNGLVVTITRSQQRRAMAQFFLLSIARHSRPRLAMAAAAGAVIAWAGPGVVLGVAHGVPAAPTVTLLGIPFAAMIFLVLGFRAAASLPAELPPRWLFAAAGTRDRSTAAALRRVAIVLAVVAPSAICCALAARWWGLRFGAVYFGLCVAVGIALVEIAFHGYHGVPCASIWRPDGANLRAWWPVYIGSFILIVTGIPAAELRLLALGPQYTLLNALPLAIAGVLRWTGRNAPDAIPVDDDEPPSVQVLDI